MVPLNIAGTKVLTPTTDEFSVAVHGVHIFTYERPILQLAGLSSFEIDRLFKVERVTERLYEYEVYALRREIPVLKQLTNNSHTKPTPSLIPHFQGSAFQR